MTPRLWRGPRRAGNSLFRPRQDAAYNAAFPSGGAPSSVIMTDNDRFAELLEARTACVSIVTFEEQHALGVVRDVAQAVIAGLHVAFAAKVELSTQHVLDA